MTAPRQGTPRRLRRNLPAADAAVRNINIFVAVLSIPLAVAEALALTAAETSTLQANLPSLRFLDSQGYDPPETAVDIVSGLGTMLGSFLAPTGVSLSLPATSLVAGPGAADREIRHRAVGWLDRG
jgi:hypothetical protein